MPRFKVNPNKTNNVLYIIGDSNIHGKGAFASQYLKGGQTIGLVHDNDQPASELGKLHNHSEQPNCISIKEGSKRYLVAGGDIQPGEELTTDYRMQPELEQPDQFQVGGSTGDGGEYIMLDDDGIKQYKDLGYYIEEAPEMQMGGEAKWRKNADGSMTQMPSDWVDPEASSTNYGPQSWLVPQKPFNAMADGKGPTVENARLLKANKEKEKRDAAAAEKLRIDRQIAENPVAVSDNTRVQQYLPEMPEGLQTDDPDKMMMQLKLKTIDDEDEIIKKRKFEKYSGTMDYISSLDKYSGDKKIAAEKDVIDSFKAASPTDVIALQEELLAEGYNLGNTKADGDFGPLTEKALKSRMANESLDIKVKDKYYKNYSPKNENQVKKIQEKLLESGYLVGDPEEEIDGKFGDKTKAALEKFNASKEPTAFFFTNIPKKMDDTRCSAGMCQILEQNDVMTEALGVKYKNAWDIQENMDKKQNSTPIYNIYNDERFKKVKNGQDLVKLTREVKRDSQTTPDMYKEGDVIGIFWPSSDHHDEVLKSKTHNTHVGFISKFVDGVPYVTHNVHGTVKTEPYSNVATAWIQRPNANVRFDKEYNVETKDGDYTSMFVRNFEKKKERKITPAESKIVSNTMNRAHTDAENLPKMLGSSVDPRWLEAATFGITSVESGAGIGAEIPRTLKDAKTQGYNLGDLNTKEVAYWLKGVKDEDISLGIGKTKFSGLDDFSKQYFNVNSPADLADDNKAIDIVSYNLIKHYDTFKDYAEQFPELKLTEDDIRNMAILAHNRGDKKLLTLGRRTDKKGEGTNQYYEDSKMQSYLQEVKGLRDMSRRGATETDASSSNWRFTPDAVSNLMVGETETYVSKVKRYIDEIYGDGYSGRGSEGSTFKEGGEAGSQQNYFEEGGEFTIGMFDDNEIAEWKRRGYRIEEME
jgi:peptidoglycan hydrolase-like protein with peptidoglycan-binding domain